MTVHRRILKVPEKVRSDGLHEPEIEVPVGVNVMVLEHNHGAGYFVVELWLTDLTHDPSLVNVPQGELLPSHPASPEKIGKLALELSSIVETDSAKIAALVGPAFMVPHPTKPGKTLKPLRYENPRGKAWAVLDEG